MISDNGSLFISDEGFEHMIHRLNIKHVKTLAYRPQSNQIKRANHTLLQMISSFVEGNHENWDQFLKEFAFAIRMAAHETTGKTPTKLFLGRKLVIPLQKFVMVTDGAEFMCGNIEKLFEEVRRNTKIHQEKWAKYYDKRRREVNVKVKDLVLDQMPPISSSRKEIVVNFILKFKGPYEVLKEENNNIVIWKLGKQITVNVDQVRFYQRRERDEGVVDSEGSNNSRPKAALSERSNNSTPWVAQSERSDITETWQHCEEGSIEIGLDHHCYKLRAV
ncbi:retrovirus-related Pol polyprotein from transposon 297 [Trichonephila clavipes]|nr:retrovirus-related Pol polyprotein from transposon 297 [Trichonephila clavipes]